MVALSGTTRDGFRWRLAPALVTLAAEVDELYPDRDRRSDGSIASAAHSQINPSSDHEADRADGLVKALDLTDDDPYFDVDALCLELIGRRDPRIKYVIFDGQIVRSYRFRASHPPIWTPEPYRGTNPHETHAHISVTTARASDSRSWFPAPPSDDQEDELAMWAELIRASYFEAGRNPDHDPRGLRYWLQLLAGTKVRTDGHRLFIVNYCRLLLKLPAASIDGVNATDPNR